MLDNTWQQRLPVMYRFLQYFNWPFFGVLMALVTCGLINLYSATSLWADASGVQLFWAQLAAVGLGSFFMVICIFFDYRLFKEGATPLFILSLLLLLAALLFGPEIKGTRGWIRIGGLGLQPSEFAKLAYIFVAARYFSNNPSTTPAGYGFSELWRPFLLMCLPFGLIVLQGDMGSSLFLIAIFVSLALFIRIRSSILITCTILAVAGASVVFLYGLKEYQRERIFNFMHPEADVKGSGYHLVQSKIAVGSGKIFGKGYMKGNINKLRYLPEKHTDFIFPVLAEEWGFVGSTFVLGLYAALMLMGVEIAGKARDRFGSFVAIGIVAWVFWQLVINLGGVLGLMPLTGVTLPFLSYGGSSLVTLLIAMGVMLNIHLRRFVF